MNRCCAWIAAASVVVAVMAGCRSGAQQAGSGRTPPVPTVRGKLPQYSTVAEAYNQRVAPLERVWTRGTVRVWYPDEQGEQQVEQLEIHFQFIRPARMLLTLEKATETVAVLGSNETQYWWIELGKEKKAFVGEHARANTARVAELGLPVHPLDLVEVMGITPLPTVWSATSPGEAPHMRWSDDGTSLLVTVLGRNGPRRLWLDPVTYEPSRIELMGRSMKPVVTAELASFEKVEARPDPNGPVISGRLPTRIMAAIDRENEGTKEHVRMRLTLGDAEVSGKRPKAGAFNFENLVRSYGVQETIQLDELKDPPAAGR